MSRPFRGGEDVIRRDYDARRCLYPVKAARRCAYDLIRFNYAYVPRKPDNFSIYRRSARDDKRDNSIRIPPRGLEIKIATFAPRVNAGPPREVASFLGNEVTSDARSSSHLIVDSGMRGRAVN